MITLPIALLIIFIWLLWLTVGVKKNERLNELSVDAIIELTNLAVKDHKGDASDDFRKALAEKRNKHD